MPAAVAQQLRADDLTVFSPNTDLSQQPASRKRDVSFNILFPVGQDPGLFLVNGAIYDPGRIDFKPVLGSTEDWDVTSAFAAHVFHIHVNPFQIVSITDPSGKDVSLPGAESGPLEFLMYPQAETSRGRVDSLDPDGFRYEITAREIAA